MASQHHSDSWCRPRKNSQMTPSSSKCRSPQTPQIQRWRLAAGSHWMPIHLSARVMAQQGSREPRTERQT
eukprot:12803016-Alexandrium_andersonii.AAC.1